MQNQKDEIKKETEQEKKRGRNKTEYERLLSAAV